MIFDRLDQSPLYERLHPGFGAAFQFLNSPQARQLPPGKHPLDGERLFVMVGHDQGRSREGAKLEAHRKYLDIQLLVRGQEEIGWRPAAECVQPEAPFQTERDIIFYLDRPEVWLPLPCEHFMIFWPSDAHAPLGGAGELHKIVMKVAVDWQ